MISSKRPACLADHARNLTGPADALLALKLTLDTGQRLTRPAAHDGIPHINWQTSARALPLNVRHPIPMAQIEWHRTRNVCTKRICAIASGPELCAAF